MERIAYALDTHPPGTVLRWDKLLQVANRHIEPTEEEQDPLRLELTMEEFKLVLRMIYSKFTKIRGDGIVLMRDFLPKMYDKHNLERGKRVSQKERDDLGITDEAYAYGELDPETFVTIYHKVTAAYVLRSIVIPFFPFFYASVSSRSRSRSITACLHSLTPHGTSLTIIIPIPQSIKSIKSITILT
jgi:hypothetical protein